MPDQKFYDFLNLKNTIKNWNDFSQAKFSKNSFNDIKMLDIDINCRGSYIKGFEFFETENFNSVYLEKFEDNFRKFLEDCDRLELLNINCDFNSFWGGISNKLIEYYDDETPKITKVIFGSDVHSSFMKKKNQKKQKEFSIDLNSILESENVKFNSENDENFSENLEKMVNYLWYFTDLELNKRNILFHPILRGMNPKIIKDLYNYDYENFNSDDPIYNYYFSSICGANQQNLYIPQRSKYCGNLNYLNNLSGSKSLNFFETTINFCMENPVEMSFPKLFGEKQFKNSGLVFNLNRNTNSVYWPVYYGNLEKTKNTNFSVIHGFNENYRFIDDKIDSFLRKTGNFNYTCIDGFNLPFCFPRKINLRNNYIYSDEGEKNYTKSIDIKKDIINDNQQILVAKTNIETENKEIFLNKLNISSTFTNFQDYPNKFIHVLPKMMKENDQLIKKYLNAFDMGKFIEYREKLENYYEFLENYKQSDIYGLGFGEHSDNEDNNEDGDY